MFFENILFFNLPFFLALSAWTDKGKKSLRWKEDSVPQHFYGQAVGWENYSVKNTDLSYKKNGGWLSKAKSQETRGQREEIQRTTLRENWALIKHTVTCTWLDFRITMGQWLQHAPCLPPLFWVGMSTAVPACFSIACWGCGEQITCL